MKYPITQVETKDGFLLHSLFVEAKNPKAVFINIHGTASNFYEEDFIEYMTKEFVEEEISMLSTNNRGTGVYDAWAEKGAAVEMFEDCLLDIDAWVEFVIQKGYTKIILSGHSLGTEKVVYYMAKGKYKEKISGVILLAPASSPGYHIYNDNYQPSEIDRKNVEKLLEEAQKLIDASKGDEFMKRTAYAGIMPKSARSLVNTLGPNAEILKALPFHTGKLEMYKTISAPIFAAIGDKYEYTAIPPDEALKLMEQQNAKTETHYLKNCSHDFTGHEEKLTKLVTKFIKKIL
ncbi:MAG: DUF1749 domain-containing protein [Candidatus Pacebacteria bacterium]|nr:DUF1749 domain-containing protein [Candidatus Paceibacterota bacterium]